MSLVSTLMSGVTESALNLGEFDYSSEASMESYWLDAACESLVSDIYSVDRAYLTADVIGEVKTVTEGADPQVLLEGMIATGIEKIKNAFRKFLAKIKEWAAKVKRFFKIIFLKGKDFVKEFGKEIRTKSVKGFKYKGYIYDIEGGNTAVDNIKDTVDGEINRLLSATDDDATRANYTDGDAAQQLTKLNSITDDQNASDWQDKLCKDAASSASLGSASDLSELMENLTEKYHGGDSDKQEVEDFEGKDNDPSDMLSFIESSDKSIKQVENDEKKFEKEINGIIKHLDKLAATSKKDRADIKDEDGNAIGDAAYKAASKVSGYLSTALTVQKSAVDKKVAIYKEAAGAYTTILKSFLRYKPAKESYDFADADSIIALTEAGDAVEPDVSAEDDGAEDPNAKDDKKTADTEGCKKGTTEGAALFESAYKYLGL